VGEAGRGLRRSSSAQIRALALIPPILTNCPQGIWARKKLRTTDKAHPASWEGAPKAGRAIPGEFQKGTNRKIDPMDWPGIEGEGWKASLKKKKA